jgi:RNA polymerase sigma factor (sigma-70 family)
MEDFSMADWALAACFRTDDRCLENVVKASQLCMDEDLLLLDRFLAGRDESVFRLLYRQMTPQMLSLALRLTGGRSQDAEDVVQEAWSRACKTFQQFRRESRLSTWLCGIVVNCFREQRRGERYEVTDMIEEGAPAPRNLELEQVVQRLPDRCRTVLVLHDIEGYTHEEISRLLNIAEGTSKHHLFRARRLLEEWLKGS